MAIPHYLIEQIKVGQVVLFLGSGASKGASHPEGKSPPVGDQLANLLSDKFLGTPIAKYPLARVAELSVSESDLFTVQNYIHSIFINFSPADFHKLIPSFTWPAIASTNYDLIIERAYDAVDARLQQLVAFRKDGERVEDKIRSNNNVIYLKLHGCITDTHDENVPLILTPDQYLTHKKGRKRLFERLYSLACEYPILFVGYTLSDEDIRAIILELEEQGSAKPRSYLLAPNITDEEIRFWETKKITSIKSTFENLLNELTKEIPEEKRVLSNISLTPHEHPIFSRLRVSEKHRPSESFLDFLASEVDYLHKSFKVGEAQPQAFYKGFFVDWDPIVLEYDVRRSVSDNIMSEVFLATEDEKQETVELYLIKGHAGSGKSVICKRLAWDASIEFNKLCLFVKPSASPRYESIAELYKLYGDRIYLFFDSASEFTETIEDFIRKARKDKIPLTIITAERNSIWNESCENLKGFISDEYRIKYLNYSEILSLVELLEKHNSSGDLQGKTTEEQVQALSKRAGRQLLVALHEATLGRPFSDIVYDEYKSIDNKSAQALYLTVCIMHRLSIPTRAGLISRVHGIPFRMFKEKLFAPLEHIVFARKHERLNDYNYLTRHPYIAEMVFERVLTTPQDRYDEYVRIINSLDIDYRADFDALKGLLNTRHLLSLFNDPQMIRQIFQIATDRFGENTRSLQQEAIFEMKSRGGSLDKASSLLRKAHKKEPHNKAVAHSLAELALKESEGARTDIEKTKHRSEARRIAVEILNSREIVSAHPYHTLVKIGLEELSEYLSENNIDRVVIEKQITTIEKYIRNANQQFPGESFILEAEGKLQLLLNNHPAAIESLKKAFGSNKRSPYLAITLSRLHEGVGNVDDAVDVLKQCVEANPADKNINFELARLLNKQGAPKAEIKHHLRRSYTQGDSNYEAQFWFARILYLEGDFIEAKNTFSSLANKNIDINFKRKPRGLVKENKEIIRYRGIILRKESSYCFVTRDLTQDSIFAHMYFTKKDIWESLSQHQRVIFSIGFNYRGPVALDLEPE